MTFSMNRKCVVGRIGMLMATLMGGTCGAAAYAGDFQSNILISDGNAATDDQAHAGSAGMNATSFRRNALYTVGDQQFALYYDSDPDDSGLYNVTVARRYLSQTTWDIFHTPFVDENSNATDGHNVISFGIDGDGILHMSWGMHDDNLLYTRSSGSVLGSGAISFQSKQAMNGSSETGVTYPEFYNLPDGDLLFMYRTPRVAGGAGSGNGDTRLKRYDTATDTWTNVKMPLYSGVDAGAGSYVDNNAYFNRLGFDDDGNLLATWTIRNDFDYQSNHNLFFAKSADQGVTWTKMDGTAYATPINEAAGELIASIPTGYSLINQADMTVDANGNPVVATWWAPGTGSGNFNRQYMLVWYDGSTWQTTAITDRTSDTSKKSAAFARDLARPIVVTDDEGHVIVAMRYRERGDVLTLAISSSEDRNDWTFIDLDTGDLGDYEPVYDPVRWARDGVLSFLSLPIDSGSASAVAPISVYEWDSTAYFESLHTPEPTTALLMVPAAVMLLRRRRHN